MIIGVTHDPDGRVVQRLSVSTKVAIGLPPNGDRNYPTKLDHFVFLRKKRTAKGVEWDPDPELMKHYGNECRTIRIVLIDDDIENVFPTSYAWWAAVERRCWGDGSQATRRTAEKPGGEPWKPCGKGCPELATGQCKPSGDLRFVLADFPRLGSICRIHTTSYRSIRQIHSALQEIQSFTGGRLAGLTAKLVVRPEGTAYIDPKDKRKKSTTIWALSLEVDGQDMKKLVANLTENARVFADTRKLLGNGRVLEVVEDEADQAAELANEFYSASDGASSPSAISKLTNDASESARAGEASTPDRNLNVAGTSIAPAAASVDITNNDSPSEPTAPWELEPKADPKEAQETTPPRTDRGTPDPAPNMAKSNGSGKAGSTGARTINLRGNIGPLEPDEAGNTVRHNARGVEFVVFRISQNGSAATIYCNRSELLPEIARRQGKQVTAQVSITGKNGHTYSVLERFLEG
jgi:hypothetical protein